MLKKLFKSFLIHYEDRDYVIRQKAAIMLVFCVVMFFMSLGITVSLPYVGGDRYLLYPLYLTLTILLISGYLMIKGYYSFSSHSILIVCFFATWYTLFVESNTNIVSHLDTIVIVFGIMSVTPIAVSENKYGILCYSIVNIILFAIFLVYLKSLAIEPDTIIEYAIDNSLSFILLSISTYYIFNINKVALDNARESEISLRSEKDLLDRRVTERTQDLNRSLEKVEEINNRSLSSLRYARKIQLAILPGREQVDMLFQDYFIIWMPRDVVGGDFYYIDKLNGITIVAVADCTGHGVPGAFMTMVASSELRRIVREEKCFSPNEILSRLNTRINQSLRQGKGESLSDEGLDIGICVIVKGMNELLFAGAKMPLYYIADDQLEVIKGDRYSVGYVTKKGNITYKTHRIKLAQDMKFYMVTDGYIDQPGEGKRRRFSTSRFKQLLVTNHKLAFDRQQLAFLAEYDRFKGNRAAVDDITVVAFQPQNASPL